MMNKGFTLIETLVAITILLVSLAGPLSVASQALRSAYYARDEITASYLAQEGIEYVRAVRDQNYLASPQPPRIPYLTGVTDCIGASCTVDFPNFSHAVCPNGVCGPVLVNSDGLYNEALPGTASPYTRVLTIENTDNPDEVNVKVTVTWTSAGIKRTFVLAERVFNWQ